MGSLPNDVRSLLDYDAETGVFTWRKSPKNTLPAGTIAGVTDSKGYRIITIGQRPYKAHRLAWLYVHGQLPATNIDHINGVRSDNRIANLRECERWQNCANSRLSINNTSGFKGVYFNKRSERWMARISVNGKRMFLGLFRTPDAAHHAYSQAASLHHGNFARVA